MVHVGMYVENMFLIHFDRFLIKSDDYQWCKIEKYYIVADKIDASSHLTFKFTFCKSDSFETVQQ